jgi:vitamin B12 transporter
MFSVRVAHGGICRLALLSAFLLPAIAIPTIANAQAQADLPVIEVTSPTRVSTPANQIASSVTVITAKDLERDQRRTVSDALQAVPGLNVIQSGGPGGQTAVFIRGANSNHVKVLIDGIEASDPSNSNRALDFGHLQALDIERIEVLRGPQSGLYGADAIGGVIAITTKKGNGPPRVAGTIEGGSFQTFNQFASLSGSQDRFNYALHAAHLHVGATPVTPARILPAGRQSFPNWYDNQSYSSKLGYDINEYLTVNWVGRYTDSRLYFTGGSVPAAAQSRIDVDQYATRGEAVVRLFDGRFMNYFGVNYTDIKSATLAAGSTTESINKGQRVAEDWRGVVAVAPGQTLVMGFDNYSESAQATSLNATTGNRGGYLEWQAEYAKRLFLVANVRNDWNDSFGSHTTFRVAPAAILPGPETKVKATYGTGFKPPSLFQLYFNDPFFRGNPALHPETSVGYDFGFEQPVFSDRFLFGVTRYVNKISNEIASDRTFTTLVNVDEAYIRGYEAFATLVISSQFSLRGDYTYTRINATSDSGIVRRPPHKYSVKAIWTPTAPWELSAAVITTSSWRDFDRVTFKTVDQEGYTTVNLAASYQVNQHLKAFGRIDNLFNRVTESPNGFLRPGLGVFGGITVANR